MSRHDPTTAWTPVSAATFETREGTKLGILRILRTKSLLDSTKSTFLRNWDLVESKFRGWRWVNGLGDNPLWSELRVLHRGRDDRHGVDHIIKNSKCDPIRIRCAPSSADHASVQPAFHFKLEVTSWSSLTRLYRQHHDRKIIASLYIRYEPATPPSKYTKNNKGMRTSPQ